MCLYAVNTVESLSQNKLQWYSTRKTHSLKNVVSNLTSAMVTIIIVSVWFYLEYHDSNIKPCIKIITSTKLLPFFVFFINLMCC